MTERDLTRVLIESVADVHLPDTAKRNIRMATKEESPVKRKMTVGLVLALILTMLTTIAMAAGSGILDFLLRTTGRTALPDAAGLIQQNLGQGENDYATYTVTEAIYDGRAMGIMVQITPKDEHTLLISEGWMLDDPYGSLAYDTETEMLADLRTIAEYAAENGYTCIAEVGVSLLGNADYWGNSEWDNNTMTILYSMQSAAEQLVLPVEYYAVPYQLNGSPAGDMQQITDELTLTTAEPLWQASSDQIFELPEYGVRIDGVTLTGTSLGVYCDVHYTCTSLDESLKDFWPEFHDAQGNRLQTGALGVDGSDIPSQVGEQLVWRYSLAAMQEAPAQLVMWAEHWRSDQTEEPPKLTITLK
ncbi:MAG: hypothetical protein IJ438_05875 [Clostridia bacterium]|nr:hypothetical protein [Clostridia bacterium]